MHTISLTSSAEYFTLDDQYDSSVIGVAKPLLTKSVIQSHRQCAKRAWLEVHGELTSEVSMSDRAILNQGRMVHAAGRSLFEGANTIRADLLLKDAAQETKRVLADAQASVLGASFVSETLGLGVRLDVLEPGQVGYKFTSICSGSEIKENYLDDCAMDVACLQEVGVPVQDVYIMYPNTKAALPVDGSGAEVLTQQNVTNEVKNRALVAVKWIAQCASTVAAGMPACEVGEHCKSPSKCPFMAQCGQPVENTDPDRVQYLPSKSGAVKDLILAGIKRISDMPFGAMTHAGNALVWAAIAQDQAIIRAAVAEQIRALPYPRNFVDFEAAGLAIPKFEGMRPYQALPFQWSLHTRQKPGGDLVHNEFIDVSGNDPRRGFVQTLLAEVGSTGPIFVFSHYEKTRLKELALDLPDLREEILSIVDRLVDLLPMARVGYYHPKQYGSWSLKKILPTLPHCSDLLAYTDMGELADGLAAQAAYMDQIDPSWIGEQKAQQLKDMLRYCKADTRGLVHFVDCMESAQDFVSDARRDFLVTS